MPKNYTLIDKTFDGKRADINKGSGGRDIYLAYTTKIIHKYPITDIEILQLTNSKSHTDPNALQKYNTEYKNIILKTPSGDLADLNRGSGGADIYIVLERHPDKPPIVDITVSTTSGSSTKFPHDYIMINKNLNEGSGGKYIFIGYKLGQIKTGYTSEKNSAIINNYLNKDTKLSIYILKLESNKYYVGKTNNPKFRVDAHFDGDGSEWTKKYKPKCVMDIINDCDNYDEDKYTIQMMAKYGIINVRGGSFVKMQLDKSDIKTILKMINGVGDRCFYCGNMDHFIKQCSIKRKQQIVKYNGPYCHRCDRGGHYSNECYAKYKRNGNKIGYNCYRCGRYGHWKITCNEVKDVNGKKLGTDDNLCIIM